MENSDESSERYSQSDLEAELFDVGIDGIFRTLAQLAYVERPAFGIKKLRDIDGSLVLKTAFRNAIGAHVSHAAGIAQRAHQLFLNTVRRAQHGTKVDFNEIPQYNIRNGREKYEFFVNTPWFTPELITKLWGKFDRSRGGTPKIDHTDVPRTLYSLWDHFAHEAPFDFGDEEAKRIDLFGFNHPEALSYPFSQDVPGVIPAQSCYRIKRTEDALQKALRSYIKQLFLVRKEVLDGTSVFDKKDHALILKQTPKFWPDPVYEVFAQRVELSDVIGISLFMPGGHVYGNNDGLIAARRAIEQNESVKENFLLLREPTDDYRPDRKHNLQRIKMNFRPVKGGPGIELQLTGLPEYVRHDLLTRNQYEQQRRREKPTRDGETFEYQKEQRDAEKLLEKFRL